VGSPEATPIRSLFDELERAVRAAVEGVAASDPSPLDPFRGLYVSDEQALRLAREQDVGEIDARLAEASARLGLSELERSVLAACAAPELSPRYGRLYAYLHDDVTRKLASPRLAARLLAGTGAAEGEVLACFAADRPLRARGALRVLDAGGPVPLAERQVKAADRIAAFLLGTALDEPARDGRLRVVPPPAYDPGRSATVEELRGALAVDSTLAVVVAGPDADAILAMALGRPLAVLDAAQVPDATAVLDAELAAALTDGQLCFDGLERLDPGERTRVQLALAARDERSLFCTASREAAVALGDATVLVIEAPMPSLAERREVWAALTAAENVDEVAAKFRLSVRQIAEGAEAARLAAASRGDGTPLPADLDLGARQASSTRIGELATRLEPAFDWDDLVLPERQCEVLASISGYLRHRDLVLSEWGYERAVARDQGLKVLFAGESGTGKTMAGQVIAHDLGLELFRIDLATIVSKYIGETEKNLDRIFDAADGSNAILFFDEADALFGKRSEVRDSHDRYANIEVAYLLQKMESYAGAVILATNFRQNLDEAFLRRLDFVIDFPFPESEDRERIWRLLLPEQAPLAADIDVPFLATQFKLSGGSIRNVSLAAAFLAAEDSGSIAMGHLIRGVALEYGKLGRLTLESDFDRFHELIKPRSRDGGRS
jgi:winged helix domain-containing protein/ATPase family protein associated with various cellular activities (AAA)